MWVRPIVVLSNCVSSVSWQYIFSILLVGIDLIQKFMFVVVLKVYTGFISGSSVYTQFGFNQVAYTLWCMVFEIIASSKWWCTFLGSTQCCGVSDLIVQINWMLVDVV